MPGKRRVNALLSMASKVLVLLNHSWAGRVYLNAVASGRLPALPALVRAVLASTRDSSFS